MRTSLAVSGPYDVVPSACANRPCGRLPSGIALHVNEGMTARGPWIRSWHGYLLPRSLMLKSFGLSPAFPYGGTSPSHASRSRLRPNVLSVPIAATKAVAFSKPMPGMVTRRRGSDRCLS